MAESKRFLLRLDPRLFEALRRWAEDDLRSINGQIEYILTEQARKAGRLPHATRRRPPEQPSPPTDEDEEDGAVDAAAAPGSPSRPRPTSVSRRR
jgi:hypothetical protein